WLLLCFCSSRSRHTRFSRDWSSDVCSSDLPIVAFAPFVFIVPNRCDFLLRQRRKHRGRAIVNKRPNSLVRCKHGSLSIETFQVRSEERRVGKERCDRWHPADGPGGQATKMP